MRPVQEGEVRWSSLTGRRSFFLSFFLSFFQEGEVRLLADEAEPGSSGAGAAALPAPGASLASPGPPAGPAGGDAPGSPGLSSLKARRAVAALPALTALGQGGCFGEGVLGYATDLARQAAEQVSGRDGDRCLAYRRHGLRGSRGVRVRPSHRGRGMIKARLRRV